ncbi:MAG: IPTL-CTERM sorting domain-containing protein [Nitrospirota bacterium]
MDFLQGKSLDEDVDSYSSSVKSALSLTPTDKKLLALCTTAAVASIAMVPTADAAVVYSGVKNIVVSNAGATSLDLNTDATKDFRIKATLTSTIKITGKTASMKFATNGGAVRALASGYRIIQSPTWATAANTLNKTTGAGPFTGATAYIGVRFKSSSCSAPYYHYGWIKYTGNGAKPETGTITGWAYESSCNQPIRAGQTATDTPTLNEWGMMLLVLLAGALAARKLKEMQQEG